MYCPLGNACCGNSDEFSNSVKPARRGMADDVDVAHSADAPVLARFPMRDADGDISPEFVEKIAAAVEAADAALLREVVAELHEADLGDLIEALDPADRVRGLESARMA
jgi:magnesium transporter